MGMIQCCEHERSKPLQTLDHQIALQQFAFPSGFEEDETINIFLKNWELKTEQERKVENATHKKMKKSVKAKIEENLRNYNKPKHQTATVHKNSDCGDSESVSGFNSSVGRISNVGSRNGSRQREKDHKGGNKKHLVGSPTSMMDNSFTGHLGPFSSLPPLYGTKQKTMNIQKKKSILKKGSDLFSKADLPSYINQNNELVLKDGDAKDDSNNHQNEDTDDTTGKVPKLNLNALNQSNGRDKNDSDQEEEKDKEENRKEEEDIDPDEDAENNDFNEGDSKQSPLEQLKQRSQLMRQQQRIEVTLL